MWNSYRKKKLIYSYKSNSSLSSVLVSSLSLSILVYLEVIFNSTTQYVSFLDVKELETLAELIWVELIIINLINY